MTWLALLTQPIDITDTTSTGMPWWAVIIIAAITGGLGFLAKWFQTRATDRATTQAAVQATEQAEKSNEQQMIDQLQEQVKELRRDLTLLDADVRNLRIREIAWITYSQTLAQQVTEHGGTPEKLPIELRLPIQSGVPTTH